MLAPAFKRESDQPQPYRPNGDLEPSATANDPATILDRSASGSREGVGSRHRNTRQETPQNHHHHLHNNAADAHVKDNTAILDVKASAYRLQRPKTLLTLLPPTPPPEPAMSTTRLLIASLGNPPPYSSTRHSAGHILVKALQSHLSLPSFSKSKSYANGLTSTGADVGRSEYTLWQSPSLMNASGVALLKAYKTHMATMQDSPSDPLPGLVIVYDEMETSPSQLKLRRGATSAKGHNGLKSVQQTLQSAGLMNKLGDRFVKIGIGIGRPAGGSRSPDDISRYVLAQLSSDEKQGIESKAAELERLLEQEMVRMNK